jgi:SAM-dependent methyltransferase
MLSKLRDLIYTKVRPYHTTSPIHWILQPATFTNIWGWKPFSILLNKNSQRRQEHMKLDINERIIEIPWVFNQLDFGKKGKVLDIGWLESTVSVSLATAGFAVTALDIRRGDLAHPNLTALQGDICKTNLKANSFDYVVLLSTLEHIGLDTLYGKAGKETDDQRALDECFHVLKPGGVLVLTTPAAKKFHQDNFMRWYTPSHLKKLLKKFTIKKFELYAPAKDRTYWHPTTEKELPLPPQFGVALIRAQKVK